MFNRAYEGNSGSHLGSFFSGLLIGGLAASAAMLFMAPQSGKKTRKILLRKTNDLRDQAADLLEEARDTAEDTLDRGMKTSRHLQKQARRMSQVARERVEPLQDRGQHLMRKQRGRMDGILSAGKKVMDRVGI